MGPFHSVIWQFYSRKPPPLVGRGSGVVCAGSAHHDNFHRTLAMSQSPTTQQQEQQQQPQQQQQQQRHDNFPLVP